MKLHFIAGLPRSGSTVFVNLLAQNPAFQMTPTSGILDIISGIKSHWDTIEEFQANPDDDAKMRVMRAALEAFHNTDKVVFDKCRGWLEYIEWAELALGRKVKILVPVRDIRDILASMEMLYRANFMRQRPLDANTYLQMQTVEGRCNYWLAFTNPLGLTFNRIKDAIQRGFRDRLYFVRFETLMSEPVEETKRIYEFLGEQHFDHTFDRVEQVFFEDDNAYGIKDLHKIEGTIAPRESDWPEILGQGANVYASLNELWR